MSSDGDEAFTKPRPSSSDHLSPSHRFQQIPHPGDLSVDAVQGMSTIAQPASVEETGSSAGKLSDGTARSCRRKVFDRHHKGRPPSRCISIRFLQQGDGVDYPNSLAKTVTLSPHN